MSKISLICLRGQSIIVEEHIVPLGPLYHLLHFLGSFYQPQSGRSSRGVGPEKGNFCFLGLCNNLSFGIFTRGNIILANYNIEIITKIQIIKTLK